MLEKIAYFRRSRGRSAWGREAARFRQEVSRERLLANRRNIPFCVLRLTLTGSRHPLDEMARVTKLVGRYTRATDGKARLGRCVFGLLLVDTPEMGGRCVLDRLEGLVAQSGIHIRMELRCYDPEGFQRPSDPEDDRRDRFEGPGGGDSRTSERFEVAGNPVFQWDLPAAAQYARPSTIQAVGKRMVDVAGAAVGLVIAVPLIGAAALAIRLTSPGPAFFIQWREGRDGRLFKILKLRTMYVDAEQRQASLRVRSERDGPAFKIKNDPRVTRVGKLLRTTCVDELPQFWNVLKGDMSLVGPRPLPVGESRSCAPWHRRRLDVRPGLTCHWQIKKHSVHSFDEWMRLDLNYVDSRSLWSDVVLMVRTLAVPLAGRGSD